MNEVDAFDTSDITVTTNECNKLEAREIKIPVPWGHISGKWWGPHGVPIIATHGWQDNAGTFDTLAPLLASNVPILCVDFPGHGLSSHLPVGQFYYLFWEGVITLRRIVKHYKWTKLLGCWSYSKGMNFSVSSGGRMSIKGKWWGPREIQPIVSLHGRQDNASSFDNLIPLLPADVSVLCLDLFGHGLSSHYPKGQYYFVHWDGVILLRRVFKYFKWTKVKLMGHSLGGAVSFLYAATYPDEVEFLISLDIASPSVRDETKTVTETGKQIDKFLSYETPPSPEAIPSYDYDKMLKIVEDAYKGSLTRETAEILMKRGMEPSPIDAKYRFTRDTRLKVSLLGMFSMDLVLAYAAQIKCAYLNIRAVPGMKFEQPENYHRVLERIKPNAKRFEYHEVEGSHHVHLTHPERVAPIIRDFISK